MGSNNDINVLNQSSLFVDVIRWHTLEVTFTVNEIEHHMRYYLIDGIYPSLSVFMKGVPLTQQEKHRFFSLKPASLRKDVECVFELLKKRFNILVIQRRSYSQHILILIMHVCIILYNMIIDDERDHSFNENYHAVTFIIAPPVNYEALISLTRILHREAEMTSWFIFSSLQSDLMEHVWNKFHLIYAFLKYYVIFWKASM
jgi:hypothetical protein